MKILYGITKSNFGGAQRYVYELAVESKRLGHDVAVLCGGEGVLIDKLLSENIRVISLGKMQRDVSTSRDISSTLEMIRVLRAERPDVFHINSSKMGGLGTLAGRITGVPKIIFTAHGWAFNEDRPKWQKIIISLAHWLTILFSHKTICVSEKTKKDVEKWPFIKNKLTVVRNGIKQFELIERNKARRELGVHESESLLIGTIAELHRVKGLDVLLEAWSKFSRGKHVGLVIIGAGEEAENLHNMAQDMGISDTVMFKGYVDDARTMLSALDIFILPSRSEAMPYVPLEAGLAGAPVVASAVGGIPEIIKTGINGILIPSENPEAIVSSLTLLHDNPGVRERLGASLKKTVLSDFSLESMVDKTLEIYEQTI